MSFSEHPARQTADTKMIVYQCFMIFDFELLGRYKNKKTPYPDTAKVSRSEVIYRWNGSVVMFQPAVKVVL